MILSVDMQSDEKPIMQSFFPAKSIQFVPTTHFLYIPLFYK